MKISKLKYLLYLKNNRLINKMKKLLLILLCADEKTNWGIIKNNS